MSDSAHLDQLIDMLGFDFREKRARVLRALLQLHKGVESSATFKEIRHQLDIEEGGRKGEDALIYGILSSLEEEGFIRVDRSGYVHRYQSGVSEIACGLESLRAQAVEVLRREHSLLQSELERVGNLNTETLATQFIDAVRGRSRPEGPMFAEGLDAILKLVDSKVYTGLKKGDTIRISLDWMSYGHNKENHRLRNVRALLKRGIHFRALGSPGLDIERRKRYAKLISELRKRGMTADMRLRNRSDATYQFVGRNTDGIVLIVSESPLSAMWMPVESHPELVKNAVERFDSDYENSSSVAETAVEE